MINNIISEFSLSHFVFSAADQTRCRMKAEQEKNPAEQGSLGAATTAQKLINMATHRVRTVTLKKTEAKKEKSVNRFNIE